MNELTMGQRIAQRRKLLKLSQEALGERMGVSRQAISKWEADAALPEIDKLIAMSKLFSVTVGWLLGTEQETGAEHREVFSEEQLRTVEEIVRRYRQPPQKPESPIPAVVVAGVILLALLSLFAMSIGNDVNQRISSLYNQVSDLAFDLSGFRGYLTDFANRLNALSMDSELLSEYTLEAEPSGDMSGATVRFTAIPKSTAAGEQAWLSVRLDGAEVANAMCTMDGSAYKATVELPAANGYSYYFQVVQPGGNSTQQVLTNGNAVCKNLKRSLRGDVYADVNMCLWEDGKLRVDLTVVRSDPHLYREGDPLEWTQTELVLLKNGKEIHRVSLLDRFLEGIEKVDGVAQEKYLNELQYEFVYELPEMADTDLLELQIEYRFANAAVTAQPVANLYLENGAMTYSIYSIILE